VLKHATDLPVVDVGGGKNVVWLPAEICEILDGCAFREKIDIVKLASIRPRQAGEAIVNTGFPVLGFTPPVQTLTPAGFDVEVSNEMAVVPGRELLPPSIQYGANSRLVKASNGSWNIVDVKFRKGGQADTWWVLVLKEEWGRNPPPFVIQDNQDPRLRELVMGFKAKLKSSGVSIPEGLPRLLPIQVLPKVEDDPGRLRALAIVRNLLKDALKNTSPRPGFILVLLEKRDNFIYPGIKVTISFVR